MKGAWNAEESNAVFGRGCGGGVVPGPRCVVYIPVSCVYIYKTRHTDRVHAGRLYNAHGCRVRAPCDSRIGKSEIKSASSTTKYNEQKSFHKHHCVYIHTESHSASKSVHIGRFYDTYVCRVRAPCDSRIGKREIKSASFTTKYMNKNRPTNITVSIYTH